MAASSTFELIAERYRDSPGLLASLPGGLVPGRHRSDPSGVFGTFNRISRVPSWTTEDGVYHESERIQFAVFGPTAMVVELAMQALCADDPGGFDRLRGAGFGDGSTLVTASRVLGPVGPTLDESAGAAGARVWMATVDYLFHLSRSL